MDFSRLTKNLRFLSLCCHCTICVSMWFAHVRYYNSTTRETVLKFSRIFEMCVSWACSAERVLASASQNLCCGYRKFWPALASTHSVEQASGLIVRLCGIRASESYVTTTEELKNQLILKADTLTTDRAALAGFTLRVQSVELGKVNRN